MLIVKIFKGVYICTYYMCQIDASGQKPQEGMCSQQMTPNTLRTQSLLGNNSMMYSL